MERIAGLCGLGPAVRVSHLVLHPIRCTDSPSRRTRRGNSGIHSACPRGVRMADLGASLTCENRGGQARDNESSWSAQPTTIKKGIYLMKTIRIMGLCWVAVFAFSALIANSASATVGEEILFEAVGAN